MELSNEDAAIVEHLGDAYEKVGKSDKALERYRQALKNAKEEELAKRLREKIARLEKKI